MSNSQKKKADVGLIVMILVVVAVLVLGGFAVAPTVKNIMSQKAATELAERMTSGTATVEDLANSEGLKVDEFIAKYELTADDVNADTGMNEFAQKLTLKNYCTFAGVEYSDESFEEFKTIYEMAETETEETAEGEEATEEPKEDAKEEKPEITADTTDMEIKYAFAQYLYSIQQEEMNGAVEVDPEAEAETTTEAGAEAE